MFQEKTTFIDLDGNDMTVFPLKPRRDEDVKWTFSKSTEKCEDLECLEKMARFDVPSDEQIIIDKCISKADQMGVKVIGKTFFKLINEAFFYFQKFVCRMWKSKLNLNGQKTMNENNTRLMLS